MKLVKVELFAGFFSLIFDLADLNVTECQPARLGLKLIMALAYESENLTVKLRIPCFLLISPVTLLILICSISILIILMDLTE